MLHKNRAELKLCDRAWSEQMTLSPLDEIILLALRALEKTNSSSNHAVVHYPFRYKTHGRSCYVPNVKISAPRTKVLSTYC